MPAIRAFKVGDKVMQSGPHYLSDNTYQQDGPGEFHESPVGVGSTATVLDVMVDRVHVRWDNGGQTSVIAKRALTLSDNPGWTQPAETLYTPAITAVTATIRGNTFFGDPLEVTKAERDGIMKFVTAIQPGLYLKCNRCEKFKPVDDARRVVQAGKPDKWYCVECA